MMSLEDDLATVMEQERLLQFKTFTAETAWSIGSAMRTEAIARMAAMTFEIQLAGRTLFACTTGEAPLGQSDWIRRKRNVVMRFSKSSYAVGLQLKLEGKTLEERHGLTLADYAMHGGGVAVSIGGMGCLGSVVASGLDQRSDHGIVVSCMSGVLGLSIPSLS